MKHIVAILICAVFLLPTGAFAQEPWSIESFDVQMQATKESTIRVTEMIQVNFEEPSHGIFRTIPVHYTNTAGLNYQLRLNVDSVHDEKNIAYSFESYREGDNLEIKIGDADVLVNGKKTYVISYTATNAIRFFDDHDEIYWNITGNAWPVGIGKASMQLDLINIPKDGVKLECFAGSYGAQEKACDTSITRNEATISLKNGTILYPYEGLTAAIWFPKGYFIEPPWTQSLMEFFQDNFGFLIPVVVFIFLFARYMKYGRDPRKFQTIVVEFKPPDDLTPAEMGTVVDERADLSDISAEIIYLAVNGYLTMKEEKAEGWFGGTDYVMTRTTKSENALLPYQKSILSHLFESKQEVKLSALNKKFYVHVSSLNSQLYSDVVDKKKYFPENPNSVRNRYMIVGSVLLFACAFGMEFFVILGLFDVWIGIAISAGLLMAFSFAMPRKTAEGAEVHRKILGFKDYIATAEKYRVKFQEDHNIFEKYLPYAMIFGLADKWGKAFEDIYREPPTWYTGIGPFSPYGFSHSMTTFAATANSTLAAAPRSSGSSGFGGGGFSGGGFGGGGGGRW